ncbi:unnamed protein product [Aureobasidium pullulans]|nr:unnamed protein product [Aureobasidium pullulans]
MRVPPLAAMFAEINLEFANFLKSQLVKESLSSAIRVRIQINRNLLSIRGVKPIVAVSQLTSKRRNSLLLAANITDIDITIPDQPIWTDEDVNNFRTKNGSLITRGSAMAWMGHLNVLRWFLDSGLETMLVMEDDVDWDIHLRTSQIVTPEQAGGYWGNSEEWDILYLGHCGDMFSSHSWANETEVPRVAVSDTTLPSPEYMHILTRRFLREIGIPVKTRVVHKSVSPLCTFGFALSRPGARRLLTDVAGSEPEGGSQAYDNSSTTKTPPPKSPS